MNFMLTNGIARRNSNRNVTAGSDTFHLDTAGQSSSSKKLVNLTTPLQNENSTSSIQLPLAQSQQTESYACRQLSSICKRHFRAESWYLENMLCAMVWLLGICVLVIPIASVVNNRFLIASLLYFAAYACVSGWFCLLILPLCRIFDLFAVGLTSWRPQQLITRVALGSGKRYRVTRWGFILSFVACGIVVVPCSLSISGSFFWVTLTPLLVCSSALLVFFMSVLLTGFYSVYFGKPA